MDDTECMFGRVCLSKVRKEIRCVLLIFRIQLISML